MNLFWCAFYFLFNMINGLSCVYSFVFLLLCSFWSFYVENGFLKEFYLLFSTSKIWWCPYYLYCSDLFFKKTIFTLTYFQWSKCSFLFSFQLLYFDQTTKQPMNQSSENTWINLVKIHESIQWKYMNQSNEWWWLVITIVCFDPSSFHS